MSDVSIFDLISALNSALERAPKEELNEIFAERYTVSDKVDFLLAAIGSGKPLTLSRLFRGMRSRQEIVCTFLAMLELIKMNRLVARQDSHFDEIVIEALPEGDGEPVVHQEDPV